MESEWCRTGQLETIVCGQKTCSFNSLGQRQESSERLGRERIGRVWWEEVKGSEAGVMRDENGKGMGCMT